MYQEQQYWRNKVETLFFEFNSDFTTSIFIRELETDPEELQNFIETTDQDCKSLNNKNLVLDTNYTKAGMHFLIQNITKDMTFKRNISSHGDTKWISCNTKLKDGTRIFHHTSS